MIKIENLWVNKNDVYLKVEKRIEWMSKDMYIEEFRKEFDKNYEGKYMDGAIEAVKNSLTERLGKNMTVVLNKYTDKELIVVEKVSKELFE